MAETGPITLYRGDDTYLYFDDGPDGSVTGWSVALYVSLTPSSDPLVTIAGEITDAGSPTSCGKFRVLVTRAHSMTLSARAYYYAFKRTDTGAEKVLRDGKMQVKPDIKNKVV